MADPANFVGTIDDGWELVPGVAAGTSWLWQNTGSSTINAVLTDGVDPGVAFWGGERIDPSAWTAGPVTVGTSETLWVRGTSVNLFFRQVA